MHDRVAVLHSAQRGDPRRHPPIAIEIPRRLEHHRRPLLSITAAERCEVHVLADGDPEGMPVDLAQDILITSRHLRFQTRNQMLLVILREQISIRAKDCLLYTSPS